MESKRIRETILRELPGLFETDEEIRRLVLSLHTTAGHPISGKEKAPAKGKAATVTGEPAENRATTETAQVESTAAHSAHEKVSHHGTKTLFLYCDGASRGNPGPAAIGAVLHTGDEENPEKTISRAIGKCTNNEAEYTALIEGIKAAQKILAHSAGGRLTIRMDSELVVRQILGLYKVKNERLRVLYKSAMEHLNQIPHWKIEHVPREKNSMADALANQAYDS